MKLYQNKDWLYRRYVVQKKKLKEIAEECNVSTMTISRQLQIFGISRKIF